MNSSGDNPLLIPHMQDDISFCEDKATLLSLLDARYPNYSIPPHEYAVMNEREKLYAVATRAMQKRGEKIFTILSAAWNEKVSVGATSKVKNEAKMLAWFQRRYIASPGKLKLLSTSRHDYTGPRPYYMHHPGVCGLCDFLVAHIKVTPRNIHVNMMKFGINYLHYEQIPKELFGDDPDATDAQERPEDRREETPPRSPSYQIHSDCDEDASSHYSESMDDEPKPSTSAAGIENSSPVVESVLTPPHVDCDVAQASSSKRKEMDVSHSEELLDALTTRLLDRLTGIALPSKQRKTSDSARGKDVHSARRRGTPRTMALAQKGAFNLKKGYKW